MSMSSQPEAIHIRGLRVYPFSDPAKLIDFADSRKGILVAINAQKIVTANTPGQEALKDIINSNIAYCDGEGAVMAARQKGARDVSKIAGCELWLKIIERHHASKTFYLIGATKAVNDAVVEKLRTMYPDIRIVGHRDGYISAPGAREALIADVADKKPDVVFIAMGSPTQEFLMADMLKQHPAIYQGLGGSFDVFTGNVQRAPKWWVDHKLEFAFQLINQPQRWRRDLKYIKFMWWYLWHKL